MDEKIIERAAVAQALYKAVAPYVKTGDRDNLRGQMHAEYMAEFEATHMSKATYDVNVAGSKVGTYSLSKQFYPEHDLLRIDDPMAVLEWMCDNGLAFIDESDLQGHFEATGEQPPGTSLMHVRETTHVKSQLRIDVEKVKDALGDALPVAVNGLLEEANE